MKSRNEIIVFIFCTLPLFCFSQREANIWYFGNHAGIDFNSGIPIPLTDGATEQWEGVATFSDSIGNLLMYTDGESLWNRDHEIMPNGTGLLGAQSSTECAIIVPYPGHDSLFYLFTVDCMAQPNGLCYSLVNMNSDNGKGDITSEKNIQLVTPVSEKISAIRHQNQKDIWVFTHGWATDSFFVYLITEEGLNTTPQIIETGARHQQLGDTTFNAVGYMRASPDGTKIASVLPESLIIEVFDFDNSTGTISNPITIPDYEFSGYGVEFSPDTKKLYFTSFMSLIQIDLEAGTEEDIVNSYTIIGSSDNNNQFGALQLATDGKIYLAHNFNNTLGVINNPGGTGAACNFDLHGFSLNGKFSRLGLPNFLPAYFLPPTFKSSVSCFGDSTAFYIADITNIDSVLWDFGDIESGFENFSKLLNPKHLYPAAGTYNVILKMYKTGIEYAFNEVILVNFLPDIFLGNDTILCDGNSLTLNAFTENCSYLWNDNSVQETLTVNQPGEYHVNVTNIYTNCLNSDTIQISYSPNPEFALGNDTSFCLNDTYELGISFPEVAFLWNTGSADSSITVSETGEYWLKITDTLGCYYIDTIILTNYPLPEVFLGSDTVICPDTEIELNVYQKNASYLWNNNSTDAFLNVFSEGEYFVTLTDSLNCINSDSISISAENILTFDLGNDTLLCEDVILKLTANLENAELLWNDDSSDSIYFAEFEGYHRLTATNICGSVTDSIYVDYEYCGEIYIPNIITPNRDNLNDYFKIKGIDDGDWHLEIYNRWGTLIFQSENYMNEWDGENCSDGVYFYILYKPEFNLLFKGFVHVYN